MDARVLLVVALMCQAGAPASIGDGTIAKGIASGLSGLADFVHGVRNAYGKEGDFADKNGFDYSHVYNGILQYQVVNAYLNKHNAESLVQLKDEQHKANETMLYGGIILLVELTVIVVKVYLKFEKTS